MASMHHSPKPRTSSSKKRRHSSPQDHIPGLTYATLQELAAVNSYERGMDIRSQVQANHDRSRREITGAIAGKDYDITIKYDTPPSIYNLDCICSCLDDRDGCCKHCIAVLWHFVDSSDSSGSNYSGTTALFDINSNNPVTFTLSTSPHHQCYTYSSPHRKRRIIVSSSTTTLSNKNKNKWKSKGDGNSSNSYNISNKNNNNNNYQKKEYGENECPDLPCLQNQLFECKDIENQEKISVARNNSIDMINGNNNNSNNNKDKNDKNTNDSNVRNKENNNNDNLGFGGFGGGFNFNFLQNNRNGNTNENENENNSNNGGNNKKNSNKNKNENDSENDKENESDEEQDFDVFQGQNGFLFGNLNDDSENENENDNGNVNGNIGEFKTNMDASEIEKLNTAIDTFDAARLRSLLKNTVAISLEAAMYIKYETDKLNNVPIDVETLRREIYECVHALDNVESSDRMYQIHLIINDLKYMIDKEIKRSKRGNSKDAMKGLFVISNGLCKHANTIQKEILQGILNDTIPYIAQAMTQVLCQDPPLLLEIDISNKIEQISNKMKQYGVKDYNEVLELFKDANSQ